MDRSLMSRAPRDHRRGSSSPEASQDTVLYANEKRLRCLQACGPAHARVGFAWPISGADTQLQTLVSTN